MAKADPRFEGHPFDDGAFFNIQANDFGEFVRKTMNNDNADFKDFKVFPLLESYMDCGTIPLLGTADYRP